MKCFRCSRDLPRGKERYCDRRCARSAHAVGRVRRDTTISKNAFDLPFRAWDGEGMDFPDGTHRYVLLANSDGDYLENYDDGLSSDELCAFLCEHRARANNVWYGGEYDWNNIVRDMPLTGERHSLSDLCRSNYTVWHGYRFKWLPRKIFMVSAESGVTFASTDVLGFFQKSFERALDDWRIPVPEEVSVGKANRALFHEWASTPAGRDRIRAYNAAECRLLVVLMDLLRDALRLADLPLTSWHGAGAVAGAWLRRERASAWIDPDLLEYESRVAYHGGRHDASFIGEESPIYHYDLGSAYPWALTHLPDLASQDWASGVDLRPYGLYRVSWRIPALAASDRAAWYPFPWRRKSGGILYPPEGEGWYHEREVAAAIALYGRTHITIEEGYYPCGPFSFPWKDRIVRDYALRHRLKHNKDDPMHAANIPIKLALNSLYGKLAQGTGRDGKRGKWQCYFAAGFITSFCRAELLRVMKEVGLENIVVCATDGIFSKVPLRTRLGDGLGEWGCEESGIVMLSCGAGLYCTYEHGIPRIYRSRGMPSNLNYPYILREWGCATTLRGEGPEQTYGERKFFVGARIAVHMPTAFGEKYCTWQNLQRRVGNVLFQGTSKRWPGVNMLMPPGWMRAYLEPIPIPPGKERMSAPYKSGAYEESMFEAVDRMTAEEM